MVYLCLFMTQVTIHSWKSIQQLKFEIVVIHIFYLKNNAWFSHYKMCIQNCHSVTFKESENSSDFVNREHAAKIKWDSWLKLHFDGEIWWKSSNFIIEYTMYLSKCFKHFKYMFVYVYIIHEIKIIQTPSWQLFLKKMRCANANIIISFPEAANIIRTI